MNQPSRKSLLCPNCRKLVSEDEDRCPFCGIKKPGSRLKNNPLTRGWGTGEALVRIIIYTNIGMYVLSLLINPRMLGMGFNPLGLLAPDSSSLMALGATGRWLMNETSGWWTLLTANYLHGSVLHIFFNMAAVYHISPLITQLFGPYRFFAIYTLSGVGGFWVSYMAGIPLTIGASAALCGLIGAALYYGKSRGGVFGQAIYKQVGIWALFILLFGFMVPGINNWAHIGGMAGGALIALALGYHERVREKLIHRVLAAACIATTAPALAWGVFRGIRLLLQI
jgi:rhomboid protease GluP